MVLSYMKMLFFFGEFKRCRLCPVCETAHVEKTSVVFNFPVHWPLFFFLFFFFFSAE